MVYGYDSSASKTRFGEEICISAEIEHGGMYTISTEMITFFLFSYIFIQQSAIVLNQDFAKVAESAMHIFKK